jgi:hypothetical protein
MAGESKASFRRINFCKWVSYLLLVGLLKLLLLSNMETDDFPAWKVKVILVSIMETKE